jgi:hypothetical protein
LVAGINGEGGGIYDIINKINKDVLEYCLKILEKVPTKEE